VLAEYPDELSFEKWTLLRLEAHVGTKMAALLDRHFSEKGQKDAREILALLKLEGVDPVVAAEVLDHASTADTEELPTMIGEAFDLIRKIIPLTKADQKLLAEVKKSLVIEPNLRASRPQDVRPRLARECDREDKPHSPLVSRLKASITFRSTKKPALACRDVWQGANRCPAAHIEVRSGRKFRRKNITPGDVTRGIDKASQKQAKSSHCFR